MDLTVIVGTYGAHAWVDMALNRAIPSAKDQAPVIHRHADTLANARNDGAYLADTEWLCFLDADDELSAGYVEAMETGAADLRGPSVSYIGNHVQAPYVPRVAGHTHDCAASCLDEGNWLLIGTLIRRDLFTEVGGFAEHPCYEDWALWLACWRRGAMVEAIPDAVYRAHVRPDSRNRSLDIHFKNRIHREILAANPPLAEAA